MFQVVCLIVFLLSKSPSGGCCEGKESAEKDPAVAMALKPSRAVNKSEVKVKNPSLLKKGATVKVNISFDIKGSIIFDYLQPKGEKGMEKEAAETMPPNSPMPTEEKPEPVPCSAIPPKSGDEGKQTCIITECRKRIIQQTCQKKLQVSKIVFNLERFKCGLLYRNAECWAKMETDYCKSDDSLNYTKANYDEENKALFANSCAGWDEIMACWQEEKCFYDTPALVRDIDNLGFTWFIDSVDDLKLSKMEKKNIKNLEGSFEKATKCPVCTLKTVVMYRQILDNIWFNVARGVNLGIIRKFEKIIKLKETECGKNESLRSMLVEKLANCALPFNSYLVRSSQLPMSRCETLFYDARIKHMKCLEDTAKDLCGDLYGEFITLVRHWDRMTDVSLILHYCKWRNHPESDIWRQHNHRPMLK
ncbi:histone-lysine N-methyltransferase SETMAR, partial [Plakobranchus ocellatus]